MPATRWPLVTLTAAWLVAVGAGGRCVLDYQLTPSQGAAAPEDWPVGTSLPRTPGRYTLVLFAHPHCPCTRASLTELSWLLARAGSRADSYVLFPTPPGAPDGWGNTALWRNAVAAPALVAVADPGGRQAQQFRAATSGQVLLYDPAGRLVFRGGITAGRGHEGDNAGRQAVLSWLTGGQAECRETPVFGCPLFNDNSRCATGEARCNP